MSHYRRRLTALAGVVFCCTFCCAATPTFAQSQTFTLNGLTVDVIAPTAAIRPGDIFWISVELRPHGVAPLGWVSVLIDGRPLGLRDAIAMTPGHADGIPNNVEWSGFASIHTTPGDVLVPITVTEATGLGGVFELPLRLLPAVDLDNDTLPDVWERELGLSAESASQDDGADGDPDGDGVRNRDEFLRYTHPRGFHTRYFPEGVAGDGFFGTHIVQAPLPGASARMLVRTIDASGFSSSNMIAYNLSGNGETTYGSQELPRIQEKSFATIIESDAPFAADRTTRWPANLRTFGVGYGTHASEGAGSLSTRWLFAEGVIGSFHTYVSVLNPSPHTARLTVTYLGAAGVTPVVREHIVAPDSRATIDVNMDAAGLASLDLSMIIDSDVPIAAERSIYRDAGTHFWGAGTSSIGAPVPAVAWYFGEGVSNALFDTYLLLLNPGSTAARVEIDVLREDGVPITLTHTIAARSRATVYLNDAIAQASPGASASSSYGLAVRSLDGAPIVAERTTWWDDPVSGTPWVEGHTSMGTPQLSTRWFAPQNTLSGAAGGVSVYLLLANPGAMPATVRVSLPPPYQGAPLGEVVMTVPGRGRATLDVTATFVWQPDRPDGRFSLLLVESIGDSPVPIVAERSIYANTFDAVWELGSNTLLTPLPPQ